MVVARVVVVVIVVVVVAVLVVVVVVVAVVVAVVVVVVVVTVTVVAVVAVAVVAVLAVVVVLFVVVVVVVAVSTSSSSSGTRGNFQLALFALVWQPRAGVCGEALVRSVLLYCCVGVTLCPPACCPRKRLGKYCFRSTAVRATSDHFSRRETHLSL